MRMLQRIPERRLLFLVGASVFLITSLLMTAEFHWIDETAMFTTAINIVEEGNFHANQLGYSLWGGRPGEEVTMLSNSGDVYTKKSPLMLFLMTPMILLGRTIPQLTISRAVLFLGPLLTTIIALILFRVGRILTFNRVVVFVDVILLILGTMTLPYAQTVFGELLASVGLLLTFGALVRLLQDGDRWIVATAGAGLALACGINSVYFALAAIIFLLVIGWLKPSRSWRQVLELMVYFFLPIATMAVILLSYNNVRFGNWLETGYHFAPDQEGFTTPLWWGILGLTISPARGLVWYSPPVLLALFSWPLFHRQQPKLSWMIAVILLFHLIVFGLWWEWWGGYGWGPRFLLPVVPLLLIVALPGLARAFNGSWPWRVVVLLLFVIGLAVQIAAITINPSLYEQQLDVKYPAPSGQPLRYHHDPRLVYDVGASPIVQHWQQISSGSPSQLGWWQEQGEDETDIVEEIRSRQQPGDVIVLLDFELQEQFLKADGLPPVFGLPVNIEEEDDLAQRLWKRAQLDAKRIWLVTWYPPADVGNWYERQLRYMWASESEQWIDGRRLILFARPPIPESNTAANATFGPLELVSYSIDSKDGQVDLAFSWLSRKGVDDDYVMFVHLTDEEGRIVAQQDRQPLGGYYRTSQWRPEEIVTDRFSFVLPDGVTPVQVKPLVGWYSWPELVRLPVQADNLKTLNNSLVIE